MFEAANEVCRYGGSAGIMRGRGRGRGWGRGRGKGRGKWQGEAFGGLVLRQHKKVDLLPTLYRTRKKSRKQTPVRFYYFITKKSVFKLTVTYYLPTYYVSNGKKEKTMVEKVPGQIGHNVNPCNYILRDMKSFKGFYLKVLCKYE